VTTPDVIVRPATLADVSGIAQVHVDSWHSTYRGIFPQAAIDEHTVERRRGLWTHVLEMPSAVRNVLVAQRGSEVVGFACFGPLRTDGPPIEGEGELSAIYLRTNAQRAGIGRQLFDVGARWLRSRNFTAMQCKVVRGNPAIGFYQRLGGRVVATETFGLEGVQLVEDTYRFELSDDET
jgi:ribosomal protein S18 acetylase RimI-like enzyme